MGWAKYYEDNVRIIDDRLFKLTKNFEDKQILEIKRFFCPFCSQGFTAYTDFCKHIAIHSDSSAFFILNGKILTGDIEVNKITSLRMINYGKNQVSGFVFINGTTQVVATVLDDHNKSIDLLKYIGKNVAKTVELSIIENGREEIFHVTQSLDILSASKDQIVSHQYKSGYFYDEISDGNFNLTEYRRFLSILLYENNQIDAEMLMEKIAPDIKFISNDEEDIAEFFLTAYLFVKKTYYEYFADSVPLKYVLCYRMLIALLCYNFEEAEKYEQEIGRFSADFYYGCALLQAYLNDSKIDINYYKQKFCGTGTLRDILGAIYLLTAPTLIELEQNIDTVLQSLIPLRTCPLIKDLCNIFYAFKGEETLSELAYNRFSKISPVVCMIRSEQIDDEDVQKKILRSALKRFDTVEWFFEYASSYIDGSWIDNRVTKSMPNIYWKQVEILNKNNAVPYTDAYVEYIKKAEDISVTPLGNAFSVGCSCFVVSVGGCNIMLDCGVRPGNTNEEIYPNFGAWTKDIDAIIISHAHMDHSGAIVRAHQQWKNATVIATLGTKAFLEPFLNNAGADGSVQEEIDIVSIEKNAAVETFHAITTVTYGKWISISTNVQIRLHKAGHLLGAAMVEIKTNRSTILYTGDFCFHAQELTSGARLQELPLEPDLLITEATYYHDNSERNWFEQRENIKDAICAAVNGNKTVLLPATALGRSQELLCLLSDMMEENSIPQSVSIYIGGFSCKTCAAICGIVNEKYSFILDKCIPLEEGMIPESGSIIIASSGSMRKNTTSYKIAETINKRNKKELVILSGGGQDEDTWMLRAIKTPERFYPLSIHANKQDINELIKIVQPKNIMLVHCGTENISIQKAATMELKKKYRGNIRVILPNNETANIADIKTALKEENNL